MYGDDESPFTGLKPRVFIKYRIQRDATPPRLTAECRWDVEIATYDDVRVVIGLAKIPVQIIQNPAKLPYRLRRISVREGQMDRDEREVEISDFKLCDLWRMNRPTWVSDDSSRGIRLVRNE